MVYMYSYTNIMEFFRVLYEWLPRTLRTLLISPYSPYTPNTPNNSNELNELNTSNQSGLSHKLKEIDFNALQCVER